MRESTDSSQIAQQGETTMLLNPNEQAILTYIEARREPVTINELATKCFPHLHSDKANSWVRNSLRRMRDKLGLVKKLYRGTYVPGLPAPQLPAQTINIAEFQPQIRAAIRRTAPMLGEDEVNDMVQQVNEKLLRKLPSYDKDRASMSTFAFTVARSTTLDAMRHRQRQPQPIQLELDDHHLECDDALAVIMRQEQEQVVRSVISELPNDEYRFAIACMADDFDIGAYAAELGISRETLYVRKHRLMQKIGTALRNRLAS